MKSQIIRLENLSGSLAIPLTLLQEAGINGEVELVVKNHMIILRQPLHTVEKAINPDSELLDEEYLSGLSSAGGKKWREE